MNKYSSLFNWSLSKLLATETRSFNRARLKILFTILSFTLIKLVVVIPIAIYHNQPYQLERAAVMLVIGLLLLKYLLSNKNSTLIISQIIVWIGLFFVWSNIFFYRQAINVVTLQFVFTIIISSFYLLGTRPGIIYSVLSTIPIALYMVFGPKLVLSAISPTELASPGFEIIVILNLVTFVIINYLYHEAFRLNMSEKESLNNKLENAVKDANRASESKSDFLSTMSHELRTPLNSVIGMTQLLLEDSHSKEQAENLKILKFSAVNLHSLINDILDFNKLGADKLKLEAISVNIASLMHDICAGLRLQAKEKALRLVLKIDDAIKDKCVITDPTRITQIISNLAGNAIKFTSKGSVTVSLKVLSIDSEDLNIRFSVVDTGIGIDSDKQEAIFEPFMQASTSTTRNFGGTGLGLAIVKRLLMLFNSSINLESTSGSGSKFFFDISFKRDTEVPAVEKPFTEEFDLRQLRILVAEDNPMNRLLLKKVLSKWNNEPEFAMNGQEAVQKLSSGTFDVVLMDIHMPVMDGYEATKVIRGMADLQKSAIPVIALTASVSNNLNEKIKEAGMNDYIYKPFDSKELYTKLKKIDQEISVSDMQQAMS